MNRLVLALFALMIASPMFGQAWIYETTTTKATVAAPSNTSNTITFNCLGCGASVYCSSASTATLSRDGTAPTATEGTPITLNGSDSTVSAADIRVYTASNVGAGTTLKTYTIAAGEEKNIDLTQFGLTKGKNVSIGTDNSCRITFLGRVK